MADLTGIDPTNAATWPTHCPTCNEPLNLHPRQCLGHAWIKDADGNKTGEKRHCRQRALAGQTHCKMHGGHAPQTVAKAARRLQRAQLDGQIGGLLAELEHEARTNAPVAALLDAVHRSSAMAQVLGAIVGGLTPEELAGPNHLGDAVPHVAVTMYSTWLDRAARAAKLACDAGVDEKLVRAVIDYRFEGIDPTLLT